MKFFFAWRLITVYHVLTIMKFKSIDISTENFVEIKFSFSVTATKSLDFILEVQVLYWNPFNSIH